MNPSREPPSASSRRVVALVAAGLSVLVVVGHAEMERAPSPCQVGFDSYLVVRSTLYYSDVSASYANSIYNDVRQIVSGYLADSPDAPCFFVDAGAPLVGAHGAGTLLDLRCEVRRFMDRIVLSVRIDTHDTRENLFSLETSASFFRPASAPAEVAAVLPRAFAGRVVRQYEAVTMPEGFWGGDGHVHLGNVSYSGVADLKDDLAVAGELPRRVTRCLRRLQVRHGVDRAAVAVGGGVAWVGFIAALVMTEPVLAYPDPMGFSVMAVCGAAIGGGLLINAIARADRASGPSSRIIETLNDAVHRDL